MTHKSKHAVIYRRERRDAAGMILLETINIGVELDIDLDALARVLGRKAAGSKGKRSTMQSGIIKARAISESVVSAEPLPPFRAPGSSSAPSSTTDLGRASG